MANNNYNNYKNNNNNNIINNNIKNNELNNNSGHTASNNNIIYNNDMNNNYPGNTASNIYPGHTGSHNNYTGHTGSHNNINNYINYPGHTASNNNNINNYINYPGNTASNNYPGHTTSNNYPGNTASNNNDLNNNLEEQIAKLKIEFEGTENPKKGWIQCTYCNKYHSKSMHLSELKYCAHCWGWLNEQQINLVEGKYIGTHGINEIKNFLFQTYNLHSSTCTNNDCIYNKISKLNSTKKLHNDFVTLLNLNNINEKKELTDIKELKETKESKESKEILFKISRKTRNLNINYNLSNIII